MEDLILFEELHKVLEVSPKRNRGFNTRKAEGTGTEVIKTVRPKKTPGARPSQAKVVQVKSDPCDGCPFCEKQKRLEGVGNKSTAKLLVVVGYATYESVVHDKHDSYNGLLERLELAGFSQEDYYIVPVVRCWTSAENKEAASNCLHYIHKDAVNVQAILLVGYQPLNSLLDLESIKIARHKIFTLFNKPTIVTHALEKFSLGDVEDLTIQINEDLHRALRLATGVYGQEYQPTYLYPKTRAEVKEVLSAILEDLGQDPNPVTSVDVESMYVKDQAVDAKDPFSDKYKVWSIGLSHKDYFAVSFPLDPDPVLCEKFGLEVYDNDVLELLQAIFDFPTLTHTQYDAFALARYKLRLSEMHDSILPAYLLDEEGDHTVEYLAFKYTEEGNYKENFIVAGTVNELEWDKFVEYNAHDADIERRIFFKLKTACIKENVWAAYENVLRPVNVVSVHMRLNGIAVNVEHIQTEITKYKAEEDKYLAEFQALPESREFVDFCKQKAVDEPKSKKWPMVQSISDVDPSRTWLLEAMLFDLCKFNPLTTNEKTKSRSTDDDALDHCLKLKSNTHTKVVEVVKQLRPLRKKLSTYLEPYIFPIRTETGKITRNQYIGYDNLVHPKIEHHNTRSGRSSSQSPNIQNIKNDIEIKRAFISRKWNNGRRGLLVIHDYSQIELRIGAWLCEDKMLARALGFDVHWINLGIIEKICDPKEIAVMTTARQEQITQEIHVRYLKQVAQDKLPSDLYFCPYEEIRSTLGEAGEECDSILFAWENLLETRRTVAKKNSFGPFYGQSAASFAAQNNISVSEAEYSFEVDRKTYPRKHEWIKETMSRARKDCKVVSVFGKVRHLDYKNKHADFGTLDRRAVNTLIQGPASDVNLLACVDIMNTVDVHLPCLTCATIHDSTFQDSQDDVYKDVIQISQEIMEAKPIQLLGDRGVPFKADSKYGPNWGEMKKWKR